MKVILAGIGMGSEATLTQQVRQALAQAHLLVGARRMLDFARSLGLAPDDAAQVEAVAPTRVVEALGQCPDEGTAVVLCSGDTGFFSLATSLRATIAKELPTCQVETLCGVTSAQYLAAALGRPWQDTALCSAHGRECQVLGEVLSSESTFFLTGGQFTPARIIELLNDAGLGLCEVSVGQRLSYPEEKIVRGTAAELAGGDFDPLAVVLVEHGPLAHQELRPYLGYPGIPDELFVRGDAPMTKRDVRALVTSRCRLQAGETAWDVGAGTGSVSVEMACLQPRARVFGVERSHDACLLQEENRKRFGAYNVTVVEGLAPAALEALPAPDFVFVGGSAGQMEAICRCALEKNVAARIVATAVTLETIAECQRVLALLEKEGLVGTYCATQVSVAVSKKAGPYHMMRPESPIFVFEACGTGGGAQ